MNAHPQDSRRVLDVAALPRHAFGHQGLIWWGTTGLMVIERSMVVIVLIVYFYLRLQARASPPRLPNPGLFYGTATLVTVLISVLPAYIAKQKAEAFDLA